MAADDVAIAILAKAPVAGLAKTRLIPLLGAHGAAVLHERMIARTVATACAAQTGPVTLWAAPDAGHAAFRELAESFPLRLARQPEGDLGARMLAALAAAGGPALVIGTDCPAFTPDILREAACALAHGDDAVAVPAEDGGYVLIGLRRADPLLFAGMTWGVPTVMAETRRRARVHGLRLRELATLWDVDRPDDVERLERAGIALI